MRRRGELAWPIVTQRTNLPRPDRHRFVSAGRWIVRLLAGAVAATVLYLALANGLLATQAARDWLSDDTMTVAYTRAVTWVPGTAHVDGLSVRARLPRREVIVRADRVDLRFGVLAFVGGRFEIARLDADGVDVTSQRREVIGRRPRVNATRAWRTASTLATDQGASESRSGRWIAAVRTSLPTVPSTESRSAGRWDLRRFAVTTLRSVSLDGIAIDGHGAATGEIVRRGRVVGLANARVAFEDSAASIDGRQLFQPVRAVLVVDRLEDWTQPVVTGTVDVDAREAGGSGHVRADLILGPTEGGVALGPGSHAEVKLPHAHLASDRGAIEGAIEASLGVDERLAALSTEIRELRWTRSTAHGPIAVREGRIAATAPKLVLSPASWLGAPDIGWVSAIRRSLGPDHVNVSADFLGVKVDARDVPILEAVVAADRDAPVQADARFDVVDGVARGRAHLSGAGVRVPLVGASTTPLHATFDLAPSGLHGPYEGRATADLGGARLELAPARWTAANADDAVPTLEGHAEVSLASALPALRALTGSNPVPSWLTAVVASQPFEMSGELKLRPGSADARSVGSIGLRHIVGKAGPLHMIGQYAQHGRLHSATLLLSVGFFDVGVDVHGPATTLILSGARSWYETRTGDLDPGARPLF